jgi:hypothetical protein
LTILQPKAVSTEDEETAIAQMQATISSKLDEPSDEVVATKAAGPIVESDLWFVQKKSPDGNSITKQYSTTRLQQMIAEGKIKPQAQISRRPKDGFRALATYKEFQGVLAKFNKKAADKQTAATRGQISKINEQERQREIEERNKQEDDDPLKATIRYWVGVLLTVLPIGLGIVLFIVFLMWLAGAFSSGT